VSGTLEHFINAAQYDGLIYGAHVLFWLVFAAGNVHARRVLRAPGVSRAVPKDADKPLSAPYPRLLIGLHFVGFAVLYYCRRTRRFLPGLY
jgi:hypothetical protein